MSKKVLRKASNGIRSPVKRDSEISRKLIPESRNAQHQGKILSFLLSSTKYSIAKCTAKAQLAFNLIQEQLLSQQWNVSGWAWLTDLVDKWSEVGIAQKEPAHLGNFTILKTHFFYPIGASFAAFKIWPWLREENKSSIFMKCWKLQNTAWTSNGLPMSQDRLGLHRELVSLLITCISLALAKVPDW